ncbi:verprolin-like [Tripterygium wilfordii]|uniref:Verprolin-like n=1 Tax=Tripterygium wilfordii TaxID=458696 RepID=A0A7J7D9M3_TRIWF|nr:pollen-specific leucine-rich repeat extensin-like protein 1 [Tripterygium wilfordii]KAF5743070.1 verprolin-like [Tripterygium wilfordii]
MPRRRYSPAAPLLPLPLLIILLPTIALILLLSLLSLSSHILRPISVKKGWDSLNVLLVSFAVICGIFARRNEDEPIADEGNTMPYAIEQKTSRNSVSNEWIDHRYYNTTPASGAGRLKRNSSSYPDLRQDSVGETGENRFRFFDDFDLSKYRSLEADVLNFHRHRRQESEIQDEPKEIPVDTFVLSSSTSPPSPSNSPAPPPPSPPQPPPSTRHQKPRRAYRSVGHKRKVENSSDHCNAGFEKIKSQPPPPPPPRPPPPPSVPTVETERKYSKSERKMSNARNEIKMALTSLYSQTKRKKKRLKRKNPSDDYSDHAPEEPVYSTRPPPSPPPPPPSVFHNLFRKGSKSKRIHSCSAPPSPPPPPPRSSKPKKSQTPTPPPPEAPQTPRPESSRRRPEGTTGRPPLPTRTDRFYNETANNGGQSRLIQMPPLPPPLTRGDFVRTRSTHNSRCSSPELDDLYVSSTKGNPDTVNTMDGGDGVMESAFCPSPDVNVKAEAFIARLRDEWRLEKMNSAKENRNLDRGPGPNLGPGLGP